MNRTAALVLLLCACKDTNPGLDAFPPPGDGTTGDASNIDAAPSPSLAVVAAGNFNAGTPGQLASVQTRTHSTTENIDPLSVGDDPILRLDAAGGFVYIVNRSDGDNITQLDTATLTVQQQINTGSGTDPQDIAFIGSKLYVATQEGSGVEVIDTSLGSAAKFHFIDIGNPDPDGVPNCSSVIAVGTNVYVACELLNGTVPRGPGIIKVIDSGSDVVTTTITMKTENPFGLFETLPDGNLAISSLRFSDGSGCLEEIPTNGSSASVGCLLNNKDVGSGNFFSRYGTLADNTTEMLAVVNFSTFATGSLVPFDLGSNAPGTALSPSSEVIGDLAVCPDGNIVVADVGSGNGLRFYSKTAERTTAAINVGITPASAHGLVCY